MILIGIGRLYMHDQVAKTPEASKWNQLEIVTGIVCDLMAHSSTQTNSVA